MTLGFVHGSCRVSDSARGRAKGRLRIRRTLAIWLLLSVEDCLWRNPYTTLPPQCSLPEKKLKGADEEDLTRTFAVKTHYLYS